jgi:hypothetical protein
MGGAPGCVEVDDKTPLVIGVATASDEHALTLPAASISKTSWAEPGNEALILDVRANQATIGQLVLHQGRDGFDYTMHVGALKTGDQVSVVVSKLSASAATKKACVGPAKLTPITGLPNEIGARNAPILKWPIKKRFDDLPAVLGWSKKQARYELVYTNENGGTVSLCGGGASGIQSEIERWGRAVDIEGIYKLGATPQWERCTGMVDVAKTPPRMEGSHPIFYYGDGHNRLFESRGGYGNTCGTSGDKQADGDVDGWNVNNPGNEQAKDAAYVVTIRPLPVDMDALGYDALSGRREGVVDTYAPWLYRILDLELSREGKIDQKKTFGMEQYVYADVYVADVGGSGDKHCSFLSASSGFVLRATAAQATYDGPQMTADYVGGSPGPAVKRIAIPIGKVLAHGDATSLVFDAYDGDGIYWLALGDVFIPRPTGDNGATIDHLHQGKTDINVYVDDNNSGCANGLNASGPNGPAKCVGSFDTFKL